MSDIYEGDMKEPKTLRSLFSHPGFIAEAKLYGVVGDRYARLIKLWRLKKQAFAPNVERDAGAAMTRRYGELEMYRLASGAFTSSSSVGGLTVRGVEPCA